ncbi:hypothetical protein Nepgr_027744 [Nepenthes gracilis]|uniref:Uncharacterized protein n=1 Tax=Nepenthes gracilis TaxID=150966 RepID=A0AAD3TB31_NEPGR|nr:hypothetical protein Nepgr_027744 [Nepenthes gracilis]
MLDSAGGGNDTFLLRCCFLGACWMMWLAGGTLESGAVYCFSGIFDFRPKKKKQEVESVPKTAPGFQINRPKNCNCNSTISNSSSHRLRQNCRGVVMFSSNPNKSDKNIRTARLHQKKTKQCKTLQPGRSSTCQQAGYFQSNTPRKIKSIKLPNQICN